MPSSGFSTVPRVFALSDIHVDYPDNMTWLRTLSDTTYRGDVLILAGDVSDDVDRLRTALQIVGEKFAAVFFVPGNHELWVRRQPGVDSLTKFWQVLELCTSLGIHTRPTKIANAVWIVPLFSWYVRPEEGPDSLFVPKASENLDVIRWSDDFFTRWPDSLSVGTVADYFLSLNDPYVHPHYDAPVISCSHFLPRTDLMFSTAAERAAAGVTPLDTVPSFNFSRVAGSWGIESQIRLLNATAHVYGHQHRNRRRLVDGIWYIAHSLGYKREREMGQIRGLEQGPVLVWQSAP